MANRSGYQDYIRPILETGELTRKQEQTLLAKAEDYGLTRLQAREIIDEVLKAIGGRRVKTEEVVNYYDVLGVPQNATAEQIAEAHQKLYAASLARGALPGEDVRRNVLNEAKKTLLDAKLRQAHDLELQQAEAEAEEPTGSVSWLTFRTGESAANERQLATLMLKHRSEAIEYLYDGTIAARLHQVGRTNLAQAAKEAVQTFGRERSVALEAFMAVLTREIRFAGGSGSSARDIAIRMDGDWQKAKDYLFGGFLRFYAHHTGEARLERAIDSITSNHRSPEHHDVGVEQFIQYFAPDLGKPKPMITPNQIDFGTADTDKIAQGSYTRQLTIRNTGRGHLYGTVAASEPWVAIDMTEFSGNSTTITVTTKANGRTATITIQSNGGTETIPVKMNPVYPIWKAILSRECLIGAGVGLGLDYFVSYMFLISAANPILGIVIGMSFGLAISIGRWTGKIQQPIFYLIPVALLMVGIGIPTHIGYEEYRIRTAKKGDVWAVEPLISALKSKKYKLNVRVIRRIGEPAVLPLINALKDESSSVRSGAAEALGEIGDARAVQPLIDALKDESSEVCWRAAWALGEIGDARAVESLINELKDYYLGPWAAGALGKIGDARAVQPLIDALRDQNRDVRSNAASALGEIGDARAVQPLINALKDKDARAGAPLRDTWMYQYQPRGVRSRVAGALGQIGDARAVEPLINALKDEEGWVRWKAAQALGKIGDPRAIQPLRYALQDKEELVRQAAKGALDKLQKKR